MPSGLTEQAIRKIIKFVSSQLWKDIKEEENNFPKLDLELSSQWHKRILDTKDRLRKARQILVEIYVVFPGLKPDRIQQRDIGIYDRLEG